MAAFFLFGLLSGGWLVPPASAQACPDADVDNFADCTVPGCNPSGLTCGDCDDGDPDVNPDETEVCNHKDDDCNDLVDEGSTWLTAIRHARDTATGAPSDHLGHSIAVVGDVNSDGLEEFVVGIPLDDTAQAGDAGSAVLVNGADLTILCHGTDPGGGSSDQMGLSVAGVGDVTGDGIPDFAAGAHFDSTGQGANAGSVSVFSGADCSFIRKLTDPSSGASDRLGWSVAGIGDINGDTTPDIAAGAYLNDTGATDAGSVTLFSGADGSVLDRLTHPVPGASDQLGYSVAGIGDIGTDGVPDIAVGVPFDDDPSTNAGSVILFSGADGSVIDTLTDPLGSSSDYLGTSVARIDDVNSDGVTDILAGSVLEDTQANDAGAVVVFSGADGTRLNLLVDTQGAASDNLGVSVTTMTDVTGDGIREVVVGSYLDDVGGNSNQGSVLILDPTETIGNQVWRKLTDPAGAATDHLGNSVAAVADLSGDGGPEVLAGVPLAESVEESDVGKVAVFSFESDCDSDGVSPFGTDCDDTDASIFSGNPEICDSKDNDCDGAVDEDDDSDGFDVCDSDCDENNPLIYPGAPERCNGVDDDCNGAIDNGLDLDSDGWPAPCDCDDADPDIFPGQTEVCNYADENCGEVDEGFQALAARSFSDTADGAPNDNLGHSVAAVGDVNADGREEFAIGIPYDDNAQGFDAGSVLLVNGADLSILCRATDPGGAGSDQLGISVAGVGDVTGDGTPDFVAGARYDNTGQGSNVGSVSVFSGADCSFVRKLQDFDAENSDQLGLSVAGMPDITGDGRPEILAGAHLDNTARGNDAGSVLVFNGANGNLVFKSSDPQGRASDNLGLSVGSVGDVNFDGVADYAAGVPFNNSLQGSNAGAVAVFSGADGSLIRKMVNTVEGSNSDWMGYSVVGIDDVNSDGVGDIAVGSHLEDAAANDAGAVVIFSGADGSHIRLLTDNQGAASDNLGFSITTMPDITGDGIREVVAGSYLDDVGLNSNQGSVVIFDPTKDFNQVVQKLTDPLGAATDHLGNSVAAVSDLSGDTAPEIVAGVPLDESDEESDVGKVVVFSFEADCDSDGVSPFGTDCDDTDGDIFSDNPEVCDGKDNDCDGVVDEDDDSDGFDVCDSDCDENNPLIYPGAPELCNGVDDDCDMAVDEGEDLDSDGVETPCDCDDTDPDIFPGQTEICNYADENCGEVDEGFQALAARSFSDTADGATNDNLGHDVAAVGDVNADGREEFLIGIPFDDNDQGFDAGSVLLVNGADLSILCRATDPAGAGSDQLGISVAGVGDVTGDGTPDFVAGAHFDNTGQGSNVGSVSVFSGADCSFVRKLQDFDATNSDRLGISVAGMPDITGDGRPEIVAGAYLDDTARGNDAGSVLVFNGANGNLVFKSNDPQGRASDNLGLSVGSVGDVNFDGVADYAAGVPFNNSLQGSNAGAVAVFSGADGSLIRKMVNTVEGSNSDWMGYSVVGIDDVNSDGVGDIAVGAHLEDAAASDAGAVVIFSGADGSHIRLLTDNQGAASDYLGYSVATMPDITGDGIREVVAGAYLDDVGLDNNAGSVVIFDPTKDFNQVLHRLTDPLGAASDQLGFSVAAVADLSGDTGPEIVVGVPLDESDEETQVGKVVVFSFEADCDSDGVSPFGTDCDDADGSNFSGNPEVCDAQDNDCDGLVDEDDDGDGFDICLDCNEGNPLIYPGAPELCNGVDDDCDTVVDNGVDLDSDGTQTPCDCDDTDADINPGGTESCNRIDDDCDGTVDEGFLGALVEIKLTDSDTDSVAFEYFGQALTGIGDVNGDGAVDFAVGVPLDDYTTPSRFDAGSVRVYSGVDRSLLCRAEDPGGASSDQLGISVAGVGDVTGDGTPDFAAGVHNDNTGQGTNAGSVAVFSGSDCSFVMRLQDFTGANSDRLGVSVAGMPDITSDGIPEIVAGAYLDDTARGNDTGSVLVFNGDDGSLLFKSNDPQGRPSDQLGFSVASVGDVNFDGVPDYAAGVHFNDSLQGSNSGAVAVFSGADGSLIRKMIDTIDGSANDWLGYSIAGIGDVNSDGVGDIAAGVFNDDTAATNAGAVVIFSGADGSRIRLLWDFMGANSDQVGYSVAAIPDQTGDGIQEVLAGAVLDDTGAGTNAGSLVVFDPTNNNVVARLTDSAGSANDQFGFSVTSIGDVYGGGLAELMGGAPLDDRAEGNDVGSVVLYSFDAYDCDSDGISPLDGDCIDTDAAFPGAEICDGLDNDCDGTVPADEADDDSDGLRICDGDCDDTVPTCTDDCTTDVDSDSIRDCADTCLDADGDNYGDPGGAGNTCLDVDCDDTFATCTTDCVTDVDSDTIADCADTCLDVDGDNYGDAGGAGNTCTDVDCDDTIATCTNDCTTDVDSDATEDCADTCLDVDGDNYGDAGGAGNTCLDVDCDDTVATCTNDCTTDVDSDATTDCADTCLDVDGDNFGDAGGAGNTCADADCDDTFATCTTDCTTDVDSDATTDCADTCLDVDGDNFGGAGGAGNTCTDADCDDTIATCTTDCVTDVDSDATIDCDDTCLDVDGDTYGDPGGAGNTCTDADCDDAAGTCTTDCVTDVDSDTIPDCDDTCIDMDGDTYGSAGGAGDTCTDVDCDDGDPNNWTSCGTCVDTDTDTWFVDCDDYVTINGPDCDDSEPSCTNDCSDSDTNGIPDCAEVCPDADGDDFAVCAGACSLAPGDQCGDCNDNFATCTNDCTTDVDSDALEDCADTCLDVDGDNFGDAGGAGNTCTGADCDDTVATCTNDCTTDVDSDATTDCADSCLDVDGDNFGDAGGAGNTCTDADCDDTIATCTADCTTDVDSDATTDCADSCLDVDGDNFGDAGGAGNTCTDADCDDTIATCTTDCVTDVDSDATIDCDDTCLDVDGDNFGDPGGAGNTCNDADCNDTVTTCTTDCLTDMDTDAIPDCEDSCIDMDGDTYGSAGGAGDTCSGGDCDDGDPNNWTSCGTCVDTDTDTWFVDCDVYGTINGPDCDDSEPNCTNDCSDGNTNGLADCAEVCPDVDNDGLAVCDGVCNLAPGDQCGDCDDSFATCTDDCTTDVDSDATADCADSCLDFDGDNFGNAGGAGNTCTDVDCDDTVATCTNDCTTDVDSDTTADCADTCLDVDGDNFGDAGGAGNTCTDVDCDDTIATCTADCTTDVDSDTTADCADTCLDADDDTYGSAGGAGNTCTGGDCDDGDLNNWTSCGTCADTDTDTYFADCDAYVTINGPDCDDGAATCTTDCETDLDGDGTPDCADTCLDADSDNYGDAGGAGNTCAGADCDDTDATINPVATEVVADGVDQNCDTQELCWEDLDGDTYGTSSMVTSGDLDCSDTGESASSTDCDDGVAAINPGAPEVCDDTIDNDCDTLIDLADVNDCGLTVTVCNRLGDAEPPADVDQDVWAFTGTAGEDLTLTVAAQGRLRGNAQLVLADNISGLEFSRVDTSALPNVIMVTLPQTGEYRVGVIEQPKGALLPGSTFRGDYCLTVDASQGGSTTLAATSSVEPSTVLPAPPPDERLRRRPPRGTNRDSRPIQRRR